MNFHRLNKQSPKKRELKRIKQEIKKKENKTELAGTNRIPPDLPESEDKDK